MGKSCQTAGCEGQTVKSSDSPVIDPHWWSKPKHYMIHCAEISPPFFFLGS